MSNFKISHLEKAYRSLVMLLFTYGETHLIDTAKDWWSCCNRCDFDDSSFKRGLSLEVAIVLNHLAYDLRNLAYRHKLDSNEAETIRRSFKLVSKLL